MAKAAKRKRKKGGTKLGRGKMTPTGLLKAALLKHGGVAAWAARELGCTRQAVTNRIKTDARLRAWIEEVEQVSLDEAENCVLAAIRGGDVTTARWYLEKKGTARGYARATIDARISEESISAIVAAFGGDVDALTEFRDSLEAPGGLHQTPASR